MRKFQCGVFFGMVFVSVVGLVFTAWNEIRDKKRARELVDQHLSVLEPTISMLIVNDCGDVIGPETCAHYGTAIKTDPAKARELLPTMYGMFEWSLKQKAAMAGPVGSKEYEAALAKMQAGFIGLRELARIRREMIATEKSSAGLDKVNQLVAEMHLVLKREGISE